jgi:hypothetical protein
MNWLLRLNILALVVYASFVAAFLFADVRVFPRQGSLTPPPDSVAVAIRQGGDIEGIREIALLLYAHVSDQAAAVNAMVERTVFLGRMHFLAAFGLACLNVMLLLRWRRQSSLPG